ncbi:MAG: hypothetical protein ACTIJ9_04970 [Aequorivita sp.]
MKYDEHQRFKLFNDCIDFAFVDFLERFSPFYKCTGFIEYHLYYYNGDKKNFYKHIKYQILSVVKQRKERNNSTFDYENLNDIIQDWLNEKMKKGNEYKTKITNAKNVIVNNDNSVKNQVNSKRNFSKDKIALYSFIIAILGLVASFIIGWDNIKSFFNF